MVDSSYQQPAVYRSRYDVQRLTLCHYFTFLEKNNPLDLALYFSKVYGHALPVLELVQTAFVPNGLLNTVMSSQLMMITYAVSLLSAVLLFAVCVSDFSSSYTGFVLAEGNSRLESWV